ncbi:hypothetical protein [Pseudomonas hormoni]
MKTRIRPSITEYSGRSTISGSLDQNRISAKLTKPNQELRRELKELRFDLEQAATEVLNITKDCRDIEVSAALKLFAKLYQDADRLAALADEVKAGIISRAKVE